MCYFLLKILLCAVVVDLETQNLSENKDLNGRLLISRALSSAAHRSSGAGGFSPALKSLTKTL